MQRRRFSGTLLAAAAVPWLLPHARAASQPLRIVVPFGPGGVADLTARSVATRMADATGQPVVIDNKPGAGGVVAATTVAQAAPDGLTLLLMSNASAVSEGLFKSLPYSATKDFAPVVLLGTFDLAVLVAHESPIRSMKELIAQAKAQPGKLNIGTIAIGSTQHLAAELLKTTLGIDVQVVPFNGSGAVLNALRGGQVDAAVEILAPVVAQISGKALRALAVMGDRPVPELPGVPTVADSDPAAKGYNVTSWNALAAPARTPPAVIARLNKDVNAALAAPDVKQRLASLGVQPHGGTPEQLAALLASEIQRWSSVIQRAGIPRQ
ncbi:MAG: tripartite tricarboxylate transporter substrate-binding protein [Acidovorax sp.]|uniref:Bug family tripartite tricarboxylate transporter substrate binding protein n=1 Tax=Acidovorax sp. TaxID=1872122 RepID=UPI0039E2EBFF